MSNSGQMTAPVDNARHLVLSLEQTDTLIDRQQRILRRSALVAWVLDGQESKGPNDTADHAMLTLVREALAELVHDIQKAARESVSIMNGGE